MRVSVLTLLAATAAYAAPVAEAADASVDSYAPKYSPKPTYGAPKPEYTAPAVNPFEVISDAALAILKFKLYLIEQGAKIILSPFEQQYTDKYHPAPAYPAPATHYARGYEPKPTYGKENPFEVLSDAALAVLKFKLYLLSQGAKIILSPIEAAYNEAHHPAPEYPAPSQHYARGEYKPEPTYGKENPFEELSEAAIKLLQFKLYLIETGAKIILSPAEALYNETHHPKPSKTYY
ncbi:uncharacterized protein K489DRAFT_413672 [Dissoconium aciculare CBS 342.82]|jgi:hypothetical protein|uniref:Uncharacterized protein n=1 Tax=Dissoconium aciculare CBS 342.82 TaxID=1314786 RepID=A0A6J3LTJ7_9PEZI|nr:uncharacterized protein K489DRAFT_413672 [Dissoconium aciculare CBS 342.82]KAF1818604.1 hypothetical protein K489DRAFT_413672 [Dissoconium aciculare CBS 342.82]